jgi:hypothetical protein
MASLSNVTSFPGVIGTFMGRDALSLAVSYLELGANDAVLLPAYTCQEVLRPFVGQARVVFYDVRPDLMVDPDEITTKLKTGNVKATLMINYFGFLQQYRNEIKKICADRGILLLEDCAHSLLTEGSGETGDLSVYSFRKILPLPDGGGLRVNVKGKPVAPDFYPGFYSNAISIAIMAKSLFNIHGKMISRASLTYGTNDLVTAASSHKKNGRVLPLSRFTNANMARMSFSDVVQKRRNDFQFWQELSETSDMLEPVFGNLPPCVCPLGFAAKVKDRDSLWSRVRSAGISLQIHWRLDSTIGPECGNSHKLATQLLTLPVYPECGNKVREVVKKMLFHK